MNNRLLKGYAAPSTVCKQFALTHTELLTNNSYTASYQHSFAQTHLQEQNLAQLCVLVLSHVVLGMLPGSFGAGRLQGKCILC